MVEQRRGGRRRRTEAGFTLIELMIVVLVIAILLTIAIPTYLGARAAANDEAAQSSLHTAVLAARARFSDTQTYAAADFTDLPAVEPSLTYVKHNVVSTDAKIVSVKGTDDVWYGATKSKSGTCFFIRDSVTPGDVGTTFGEATPTEDCDGQTAHVKSRAQYRTNKKRG